MLDATAPLLVANSVIASETDDGTVDESPATFELRSDGRTYELDVLDGIPDGITIESVSTGSLGGHVEISDDGRSVNYTPFAGSTGIESFFFSVTSNDPEAVAGEATEVRVMLQSPAESDALSVIENSDAVQIDVLANDLLPEDYDGPGVITAVSYGSHGGDVEVTEDGLAVIYQPAPDFSGGEQFVYIIDDTFAGTVDVTVSAVLRDSYQYFDVDPGHTRTFRFDLDDVFRSSYSGPKQITSVAGAEHGTVEVGEDGHSLTYTPDAGVQRRTDRIAVVFDGRYAVQLSARIDDATEFDLVTIDVNSTDFEIDVLANDDLRSRPLPDTPVLVTAVSETTEGGSVRISDDGSRVFYSAPEGFLGRDSFTYMAGGGYESTVFVDVTSPVRPDFQYVVQDGGESELDVLANDFLGNGTPDGQRVITAVTDADHGTVRISEDGSRLLYTPAEGYTGSDFFTYEVNGESRANTRVFIESRVERDSYSVKISARLDPVTLRVRQNDLDTRRGLGGVITAVTQPETGGSIAIAEDGQSVVFTPDEMESGFIRFTYTVDGRYEASVSVGRQATVRLNTDSAATVRNGATVDILPVLNDRLGTAADRSFHINEAGYSISSSYPFAGVVTSLGPTEEGGTITLGDDQRTVTYSPPPDFIGTDTFEYTVDGLFAGTVRVTVHGPVRPVEDRLTVDQNTDPVLVDVLRNDVFWNTSTRANQTGTPDNPFPGTITSVTNSAEGGTVTISPDGRTVVYAPPADYHGNDSFTYTVDGEFAETVRVNVIRRTQDDRVAVVTGSADNSLYVLANDPLSSDYSGDGLITGVSETEHGGTVVISDDGRSVKYTPADGFTGTDSFTYTVDGRQHGTVTVEVVAAVADLVDRFESLDAFRDWLLQDALDRYDHQFGQEHVVFPRLFGGSLELQRSVASDVSSSSTPHSETNVQVAGVDEADLIENDGEHLYVLSGNELVILKAFPADELSELARIDIHGSPVGMYLHEDRLTIVSTRRVLRNSGSLIREDFVRLPGIIWPGPSPFRGTTTLVTVLDISDPTAPELVQRTTLEGEYRESRSIDGMLHLVVQSSGLQLPGPEVLELPESELAPPEDDERDFGGLNGVINVDGLPVHDLTSFGFAAFGDSSLDSPVIDSITPIIGRPIIQPTVAGVFETRDEYIARITDNFGAILADLLPGYTTVNADGTVVEGHLIDPEQIVRIEDSPSSPLVTVVSLDTRGDAAAPVASESLLTSAGREIYATAEHLYVFQAGYSDFDLSTTSGFLFDPISHTSIYQFEWNSDVGGIDLIGTGTVEGRLLNQFSADEHEDRLRLVTSTRRETPTGLRDVSDLTVLENRAGLLQPIGSELDVARGSQLRSVRFLGDRAYTATFQSSSPLTVIDLSDPHDPEVIGEVRSIGTPTYMQLIDDTHLLTVGRNTVGFGISSTQVSLYDVSDPSNPLLIDRDTLPKFSSSLAEDDHHAFGWFGFHQTLAIPSRRAFNARLDLDGDGFRETSEWRREDTLQTFRIDTSFTERSEDAIVLNGSIAHDSEILRSAFIGDVLYSIGDRQTKAVSINDPDQLIADVTYESDVINLPAPWPWPILLPGPISQGGLRPPQFLRVRHDAEEFASHQSEAGSGPVALTTAMLRSALATVTDTTLEIDATSLPNAHIQVITDAATSELVVQMSNSGGEPTEQRFDATGLTLVRVTTGDSNDHIDLTSLRLAAEVNSGAGDDTVRGGRNNDTIDGGAGNDLLFGRSGHDVLRGGDGDDTLKGGRRNDTLEGGAGDDMLAGRNGRDVLRGGAGDDRLRGGAHNDTLDGGAGMDVLRGDGGSTVVFDEVAGDVTIRDKRFQSDRGDRARSVGPITRLVLTGSDADDRFDASRRTRRVEINGGAGNDLIIGSSANDALEGGAGNDVLRGGSGRDRLLGGEGDDTVRGDAGVDTLSGGMGDDLVNGGGGRSVLEETADTNITVAGFGRETTLEGVGRDRLKGFFSAAVLQGGASDNTLDARNFDGRATLLGAAGSDRLFGARRPGRLVGGPGADELMPGNSLDDIPGDDSDTVRSNDEAVSEDAINAAMSGLLSGA